MGISLLIAVALAAQPAEPSFDVVSVKPSPPGERFVMGPYPGGKFIASGITPRILIQAAFQLQDYQLSGLPGWAETEKFTINAQAGHEITRDELRMMLRALLSERFGLVMRHATHETNVFHLIVARGGAKLSAAAETEGRSGVSAQKGRMVGMAASMAQLARALSQALGRPVFDQTGLDGKFDFSIEYTSAQSPGPEDASAEGSSLFAILEHQLGLKLEPAVGPGDFYGVIRISRPSEN
jgi:uncharacterized protein (TIGR03435 family)